MADPEAVDRLRRGVDAWNRWRREDGRAADLSRADLTDARLRGADLREANLREADLTRADLREADLSRADLTAAHLRRAVLVDANLSVADVIGADLTEARLNRAHLSGADLTAAQLWVAKLGGAVLLGANLRRADLTGAHFRGADVSGADFSDSHLIEAHLIGVNLTKAVLRGADLTKVVMGDTTLAAVDLREVRGLDQISHVSPSRISIDTLYLSGGQIPEVFLRGCGVPDEFIAYLPSLVTAQQAIRFYSCFISYSSRDEAFAKRLHERLRAEHVRVWFAPEDMKGGISFTNRSTKASTSMTDCS